MRDVLLSKLLQSDWEGWNNKWFGIIGSISLAIVWVVMNLWVINFPTNIRIINAFFPIISVLFVVSTGWIGLAVVDEYFPNDS